MFERYHLKLWLGKAWIIGNITGRKIYRDLMDYDVADRIVDLHNKGVR